MSYTKSTSEQIIVLNVKAKTLKHLEENVGENLHNLGIGKRFLNRTQ